MEDNKLNENVENEIKPDEEKSTEETRKGKRKKHKKRKKSSSQNDSANNELKIKFEKEKEITLNDELVKKVEPTENQDNFIKFEEPKDEEKEILNNNENNGNLIKNISKEFINNQNLDENTEIKIEEIINKEKPEKKITKSSRRRKHKKEKNPAYDNLVKNSSSGLVGDKFPEDNKIEENKPKEIV